MTVKHRGTRDINSQVESGEVDKRRRGLFSGLRYIHEVVEKQRPETIKARKETPS